MANTALITGASSGLGEQFAWLFARDGHDLAIVARRRDKLEALAGAIKAKHSVAVHVLTEDLAQPGAASRVKRWLDESAIEIQWLVNNAGFGDTGAFVERDPAREIEMLQVNIVTLIELTRLLLPAMVARKSGRVLNIGSTAGFVPGPYMAVYYASKAFVNSFSEALSVELEHTGVTATVSCPGATATEFARVAGDDKTALFQSGVMSARAVAEEAYRAMQNGRVLNIPGFLNKLKAASLPFAPRRMKRRVAAKLNQVA